MQDTLSTPVVTTNTGANSAGAVGKMSRYSFCPDILPRLHTI